ALRRRADLRAAAVAALPARRRGVDAADGGGDRANGARRGADHGAVETLTAAAAVIAAARSGRCAGGVRDRRGDVRAPSSVARAPAVARSAPAPSWRAS